MGTGSVVVATWDFGLACVRQGLRAIENGGSALDAVVEGAAPAEGDPDIGSVGLGGTPNRDGVVQVDAAVMWGPGQQAGSVAAIEGVLHPTAVARRVMEASPHVMLAGEGGTQFAIEQGFPQVDLLTEASRQRWLEWRQQENQAPIDHHNHDTVGVLALDGDGNLAASCSTSGAGYKHAGRVGDSPIIGSGLYLDNEVGAAVATGLGEDIMRYCSCFAVVDQMARGLSPADACLALLNRVKDRDPKGAGASVHVLALNKEGEAAGSGMHAGFPYAIATAAGDELRRGVGAAD